MTIKKITRKRNGKVYEYWRLGKSCRNKNGNSVFRATANLTLLSERERERIRHALQSESEEMILKDMVNYEESICTGSHWVVCKLCERLGLKGLPEELLERESFNAVMVMLCDRVVNDYPYSKVQLFRKYNELGISWILKGSGISFQRWYRSLEELLDHKDEIEDLLWEHKSEEELYMYDITSLYFEGNSCPIAKFGCNRDGKRGKLQVVCGLLTDSRGMPLSIEVFEGNRKDSGTVTSEIVKLKERLGKDKLIFAGDRGMLISDVREHSDELSGEGIDYITALTRREILKFVNDEEHPLQVSLFDKEIGEVSFEGKRYIVCFNPVKRDDDRNAGNNFLDKTECKLRSILKNVEKGRYKQSKVIAEHLCRWLNHRGVGRCFNVEYGEGYFKYERREDIIKEQECIDGFYVLETTVDEKKFNAEKIQRKYKNLTLAEQGFRHMKTADGLTRPIRHWNEKRVRGHIFMCMPAYFIIWHAGNIFFADFLEREQDGTCEAGSLREIWDSLDKGVTIGKIAIGENAQHHLSHIPPYQKKLLLAAKCPIWKKEKIFLRCKT